jgi:hypothetical protein
MNIVAAGPKMGPEAASIAVLIFHRPKRRERRFLRR